MPISVVIQLTSNISHTLQVEEWDSILFLKLCISVIINIPVERMLLVCDGVKLNSRYTIKDYNLCDGDIINLINI